MRAPRIARVQRARMAGQLVRVVGMARVRRELRQVAGALQARVAAVAPATRVQAVLSRLRARAVPRSGDPAGRSANGPAPRGLLQPKPWVPRPTSVTAAASNTTTPTTRVPPGSR